MTTIALMVTILIVVQYALSFVIGINLVFPLLIIYTYSFGLRKGLLIMFLFVLARMIMGLTILTVILWTWSFFILVILAHLVNKLSNGNEYIAAIFTFFYFILFGILAGVQEQFVSNIPFLVYWIQGLPSDSLGGIAGFISTLTLLKPLSSTIMNLQNNVMKNT